MLSPAALFTCFLVFSFPAFGQIVRLTIRDPIPLSDDPSEHVVRQTALLKRKLLNAHEAHHAYLLNNRYTRRVIGIARPPIKQLAIPDIAKRANLPPLDGDLVVPDVVKRATRLQLIENASSGQTISYDGIVSVGSQQFSIDLDVGSTDFWLAGPADTSGRVKYLAGPASKPLNKPWTIAYQDGSTVAGTLFSDTVTVGDLSVTGQVFAVATATPPGSAYDGM